MSKELAAQIVNSRWGKDGELNRSRLQDPNRFNIGEKSHRLEQIKKGKRAVELSVRGLWMKIKPKKEEAKVEKTGEIATKNNEQWQGDRQKLDLIW